MLVADASRVKELADWVDGMCVSLFLPAHEIAGREVGDLLRLKNLLREAANELVQLGMRRPEADRLVGGVKRQRALSDSSSPVFHRAGVALFAAPGVNHSYRLAEDAPTVVAVARRFHLKPLLQMLAHDRRFFVLAVTRGFARLFLGDRGGLRPLDVPTMPASLDDAVLYDDRERALMSHSASRRGDGGVVAAFHGQGDRFDHLSEDMLRYLRKVDASLNGLVRTNDPLVLAGSRDVVAAHRELSNHGTLMDQDIYGNPEVMAPDDLHLRAWDAVEAAAEASTAADVARFCELNGTGKASSAPVTVIEASSRGRIETMFVASDVQLWGRLVEAPDVPEIHDVRMPGDEDLFDTAAVGAWRAGATVHVVPLADVPGETGLAAVFRY